MKKLRKFLSQSQLQLKPTNLILLLSVFCFSQNNNQYKMISDIILDRSNVKIMSLPEEMIYNREHIDLDSIIFIDKKRKNIKKKYVYDKSVFFCIRFNSNLKNDFTLELIFQNRTYNCKLFFKEGVDISLKGIKQENKDKFPILYFNSFYGVDQQIFSLNLKERVMNLGTPIIRNDFIITRSRGNDTK